jgi:hypothetical protein
MHPFIFLPLNPHMMFHLTIFLAKPMFRVNKSLLILKQTRHVMWQNILWLVLEYFSMSHNISTWQTNILRIFYDIAWNIFKDSVLFICSPTSIIVHYSSYKWGFKSSFIHYSSYKQSFKSVMCVTMKLCRKGEVGYNSLIELVWCGWLL